MIKLFRQSSRCSAIVLVPLALTLTALAYLATIGQPVHADGPTESTTDFRLKPGDHISLIGNTLADRMQHDGWLEAYLQSRFPKYRLSFRNLGFSGDELTLRLRSAGFGSPDEWLTREKTDVVFAFFGYNESFAGKAGIAKFKQGPRRFHQAHPRSEVQRQERPRVWCCSRRSPTRTCTTATCPTARQNNKRLELYTAAMAEVAAGQQCPVRGPVPSHLQELYGKAAQPLTINGIHLNEHGDQLRGPGHRRGAVRRAACVRRDLSIGEAAAGRPRQELLLVQPLPHRGRLQRLRRPGLRAVTSGSRPTARSMQREMEILDVMTANRDKRIWAVAQGKDLKVDDSNTPPFIPVKTNKPGPGPTASTSSSTARRPSRR